MRIARVKCLVSVGLKHLMGAIADDGCGNSFCTLIAPSDVKLETMVIVYQPGDIIYRHACPAELRYMFERNNHEYHIVAKRSFNGKESPTLFCPLEF